MEVLTELVGAVTGFFQWMEGLSPGWMYVAILIVAYLENVIPPIPGDLVVVFAGYLAAQGHLGLAGVIIIATVGGAIGFMTVFVVGYVLGTALLHSDRATWVPRERIQRARQWVQQYGLWIVTANRFLSGIRSVIALSVGIAQMRTIPVAVCATLSAALWTSLLAIGGFVVGENWRVIGAYLRDYGRVILVLIGLYVLYWIGRFIVREYAQTNAR